jgi:hypothetical protein
LVGLLCSGVNRLEAAPRELSDVEMDKVHGQSAQIDAMTMTQIANMVLDFTHRSAANIVSGSVQFQVEASTTDPAQVQVMVGSQLVTPNTTVALTAMDTIHIRATDASVRMIGNVNLNIVRNTALPAAAANLLARYGR